MVDVDWDQEDGHGTQTSADGGQYAIEYLGTAQPFGSSKKFGSEDYRNLFRVTGRGQSGKGGDRYVQTIYATRNY